MEFRTLDAVAGKKQALAARLNQLEQEYLSNETALLVAQSLPDSDAKNEQVAQFNANLVIIESAHAAVAAEYDSIA